MLTWGWYLQNTPQYPPYGAQLLQGLVESGASKGVMLKGFWRCQMELTPAEGRGERRGALVALGRPKLKTQISFS